MLVELLQKERWVSLERLATLFAQPIQFESHRRNLQRFLMLPQLSVKALCFPIVKYWLKQPAILSMRTILIQLSDFNCSEWLESAFCRSRD